VVVGLVSAALVGWAIAYATSGSDSSSEATIPSGSGGLTVKPGTGPVFLGGGDPVAGKTVFASARCGGCHTLKDAGGHGTAGPDLDENPPGLDLVLDRVKNGVGPMPSFKGSLSAKQIRDVAAYVVTATR
jgi:sulfite dehydrogenase